MAIVINGSGTVTGISVGGLPDGIVDAGTLATNSVDSEELIDGAVDDSHIVGLTASKLTGALPAISAASLTNNMSQVYVGEFDVDRSTTGSQSVTGVGFTPKVIFAKALLNTTDAGSSDGFAIGSASGSNKCHFDNYNGNDSSWAYDNYLYRIDTSGTSEISRSRLLTFDADGFTITKTKTGSPTGTASVLYTCIG